MLAPAPPAPGVGVSTCEFGGHVLTSYGDTGSPGGRRHCGKFLDSQVGLQPSSPVCQEGIYLQKKSTGLTRFRFPWREVRCQTASGSPAIPGGNHVSQGLPPTPHPESLTDAATARGPGRPDSTSAMPAPSLWVTTTPLPSGWRNEKSCPSLPSPAWPGPSGTGTPDKRHSRRTRGAGLLFPGKHTQAVPPRCIHT